MRFVHSETPATNSGYEEIAKFECNCCVRDSGFAARCASLTVLIIYQSFVPPILDSVDFVRIDWNATKKRFCVGPLSSQLSSVAITDIDKEIVGKL